MSENNTLIEFPLGVSNTGTYIEFTFYKNVSKKQIITDFIEDTALSVYNYFTNQESVKNSPNSPLTIYEKKSCGKTKIKKNSNVLDIAEEIFVPQYEIQQRVILYFPITQEIINSIEIEWQETDAGLIGAVANILKNKNKDDDILTTLEKKKELLVGMGFKTIGKKIGSKLGEELAAGYDMLLNFRGVNPKLDTDFLQFTGLNRRSPEFNFRFIPENEKEQQILDYIISIFELNSYPDNTNPAGIEMPSLLEAKIYVADRLIHTHTKMHINSLTINKNPEEFQFIYDGNPGVIDLAISLTEADRFYKKDYLAEREMKLKENKNLNNQ